MFYSQFILAKKGPLGTIWIAAHLERKLRKNQVADTDIGVSVDSILFPEAPIALRLSSHLLLGVVRIYSRKVNYLFHDCSEALLKIKQAFRSTAVDLPPEESTAPYHSITLPETFHLDDFELPDSAFLHGNSVDHHVSTREQITLQDTRDGLDYSTSQFGLDERFGDGDTSQIALDLDEDLFLDKVSSSQHTPVPFDAEDGMRHSSMVGNMDIAEGQILYENTNVATPKGLSEFPSSDHYKHDHLDAAKKNEDISGQHGHNIQTPDPNEMSFPDDHIDGPSSATGHISGVSAHSDVHSPELIECAQAPSTPSLIGEAIPANIQEIPPLSSQEKNSRANYLDAIRSETSGSPLHSEIDCPEGIDNNSLVDPTVIASESAEIVLGTAHSPFTDLKSAACEPQRSGGIVAEPDEVGVECGKSCADEFQNEFVSGKADSLPDLEQLHDHEDTMLSGTVTFKKSASAAVSVVNVSSHEETNLSNQSLVQDANTVQHAQGTCNLTSNCIPGAPAGEEVLLVVSSVDMQANVMETIREVPQTSEIVLSDNTSVEKPQKLSCDANREDNQLDHLNGTSSPEFPVPEKMLLAPPGDDNMSNDLGQLTSEKGVTGSEESVDRIKSFSRKKRHLTENISGPQNGSPAKLPGRPRGRRITEHIPEDDDLLASILVGRTANVKTQPTPHKVSSLKRPRLNPKAGVPKRKVLFDDTMVLHADAIRQQLINTEDIRRIRKKAPCTRAEIWMILSCSEELEIFEESIFTGISAELHGLHNRSYTSNEKQDSPYDRDQFVAPSKEPTSTRSLKIVEEICVEDIGEQIILSEKVDSETDGPSSSWVNTNSQDMVKSQADLSPPEPSNGSHPMELDDRCPWDVPTGSAPNFGNRSAASADCRAEANVAHENHEKDECDIKSDDVRVHTERQLAHEAALSSNELKDMNDDDMMALDENVCTPNGATNIIESKSDKIVDAVCHQNDLSDMGQIENNPTLLSMDSHEVEKCLHTDTSFLNGEGQFCSPDVTMGIVEPSSANIIEYQHMEKGKESCLEISVDGEAFCEQLLHTEEDPFRPNAETENIPSTAGEGFGLQEFNSEGGMNGENIPGDFTELPSSSDFWSAANGSDTEETDFLNVDDEEEYYEADDDRQNPREAQSQENSGWSSRTRYLKTLFDDEFGQGREMVTADRLLVGKTRKEASRMFFETLVLKNKGLHPR
ncbi:putative rad21/Rec8-like protein [Dioscorea sansibarensis]